MQPWHNSIPPFFYFFLLPFLYRGLYPKDRNTLIRPVGASFPLCVLREKPYPKEFYLPEQLVEIQALDYQKKVDDMHMRLIRVYIRATDNDKPGSMKVNRGRVLIFEMKKDFFWHGFHGLHCFILTD